MHVDPGRFELCDLVNHIRGDVSFDRLEALSGGAMASATFQRWADPTRPYKEFVSVDNLVSAADTLNRIGEVKTTPWALMLSQARQLARTRGLWGEPEDAQVSALPLLTSGWHTLAPQRFAAWNRAGAAFVAEQRAEAAEAEVERLRAENDQLREQIAHAATPRSRRTKP